MSDKFTPTTEQVRTAYATDVEAEYRDPIAAPSWEQELARAFDRWLAAHDAETVRRTASQIVKITEDAFFDVGSIRLVELAARIRAKFGLAPDEKGGA